MADDSPKKTSKKTSRPAPATRPAGWVSATDRASNSESSKKTPGVGRDLVFVRGKTADDKGLSVIRARDERIEIGEVRPVEPGKPLTGDLVKLTPCPSLPRFYDVETQVSREEIEDQLAARKPRAGGGPPQVASRAYRDNWDAIYSKRTAPGSDQLN